MVGLAKLVFGLIVIWAIVAATETVGLPILPRGGTSTLVTAR
jgi:hypothetical protein